MRGDLWGDSVAKLKKLILECKDLVIWELNGCVSLWCCVRFTSCHDGSRSSCFLLQRTKTVTQTDLLNKGNIGGCALKVQQSMHVQEVIFYGARLLFLLVLLCCWSCSIPRLTWLAHLDSSRIFPRNSRQLVYIVISSPKEILAMVPRIHFEWAGLCLFWTQGQIICLILKLRIKITFLGL